MGRLPPSVTFISADPSKVSHLPSKTALGDELVSTWNGKRGVVIHIACVWVCSGFTSGSAKVLGGEERLPKDTQGTLETSLKKISRTCNEILLKTLKIKENQLKMQ